MAGKTSKEELILVWITSPNPEVEISLDTFNVAKVDGANTAAKLKRYSAFLSDFAKESTRLLAECPSLTGEEREQKIDELLADLDQEQQWATKS